MVKPDYSRDYYADLGLPPSADINDIKKQYRQLGTFAFHSETLFSGQVANYSSHLQHSSITRTETRARKNRRKSDSSSSKLPMSSSPTPPQNQSTMRTAVGRPQGPPGLG